MLKIKLIELVKANEELYNTKNKNYVDFCARELKWQKIADELGKPVSQCKKQWNSLRDCYRRDIKAAGTDSGKEKMKWRYHKEMEFLKPFMSRNKKKYYEPFDSSEYDNSDSSIVNCTSNDDPCTLPSNSRFSSSWTQNTPQLLNAETLVKEGANQSPTAFVFENNFKEEQEDSIIVPDTQYDTPPEQNLSEYENQTCSVVNYNANNEICRNAPDSQNMPPDPITKFFECMLETVKTLSPELQIEVKSKIFKIVTDAERINFNINR